MKASFARTRRFGLLVAFITTAFTASAAPVSLAPLLPGQYKKGTGADATFLKVANNWQESTVLWNEATKKFGSGVAVSSYDWGTGLWGIADWNTANFNPTPGMIEKDKSWSDRVDQIAFGDDLFNSKYGEKWGTVELAKLLTPGSPEPMQDNWTARFTGYIRISESGLYNFSVLHDDGFFFHLVGADEASLRIENDYLNARERVGFDNDLQLGVGLYSFELGAYERLEAGVVELSWMRDGGAWSRVPTSHLVREATPVSEPGSWALLLAGLLALGGTAARRRHLRH
jgi:hypothetical protein